MTPIEIGVLGIIVLIALLLIRIPAGFSLILASALGFVLLTPGGFGSALTFMGGNIFAIAQNQTLSAVPLFVLMGVFMANTNLGKASNDFFCHLLGRKKGGTAIAALYTSAIGLVAPVCAAFVIFGFLSGESMGQTLMAGLFPAVVLFALLIVAVPVVIALNPNLAPAPVPPAADKSYISAAKVVWVAPAIFLVIFGSIFFALFTVVEASAVGAFLALLFSIASKQISSKYFIDSLIEAAKDTGKLFILIIGGRLFVLFLFRSLIELELIRFVSSLGFAPIITAKIALLFVWAVGLFMDKTAALVIMTPMLYPIILSLGLNGVWFGVLIILVLMISRSFSKSAEKEFLHSPAVDDVPSTKEFFAQWPFLIVPIIMSILVALVPLTATVLPRMMLGW